MNIERVYAEEGKSLQELMETLIPIYLQEVVCNLSESDVKYNIQKPKQLVSKIVQ